MFRRHRIQLKVNKRVQECLLRACGVARFAYNWGLVEWERLYAEHKNPTYITLANNLNKIKDEQFPWMKDVSSRAAEQALRHVDQAYKRYRAKQNGKPRFKRKGRHDAFTIPGNDIWRSLAGKTLSRRDMPPELVGRVVRIPRVGYVKLCEKLRFEGQVREATIHRIADKWFITISVEVANPEVPVRENQAVGIDLGLGHLAVLSTGDKYEGPKALKRHLRQLRYLGRRVSRRKVGSRRRQKAVQALARLHYRITCIRSDYTHKLTTSIVRRFTAIGIENLNVEGMKARRNFARSTYDQSFYMFRMQLEYKAEALGSKLCVAGRWYPSSKTCNACGNVNKELKLSQREWRCPSCGVVHDRDVNAACNLRDLAAGRAAPARRVG